MGGKIFKVFPKTIAEELGFSRGDEILTINDKPLRDIFDYKFLIQESHISLKIKHKDEIIFYDIEKLPEEDLGIQFENPIFDKVKKCHNSCIFCFIDQLPNGLRPSLYLKDDDYRLSFIYGNYITLTNINKEELKRIVKYRLSPLYISVHSTIDEVRLKLIRNKKAISIFEKLSYLIEHGIDVNIQIVLIPEINDGEVLKKTISDLSKLHKGILSIAIVPVGLTKYRDHLYPIRRFKKNEILSLISDIEKYQREFRKKIGRGFVYIADEFYLESGIDIPNANYYDTFSQIEDGIGMTRIFIDETLEILKKTRKHKYKGEIGIVTGVLGKKALENILSHVNNYFPNLKLSFIEVENNFFGKDITVTGLLTAKDIQSTIKNIGRKFDKILIPDIVLNDDRKFLDNIKEKEFIKSFDLNVKIIETTPKALLKNLIS